MIDNATRVSMKYAVAIAAGIFVKVVGGEVTPCTTDTDIIFGVTEYSGGAGDLGSIVVDGPCDVQFAAAQTIGAELATDANGRAKAAEAGDTIAGKALEAGDAPAGGVFASARINFNQLGRTKA